MRTLRTSDAGFRRLGLLLALLLASCRCLHAAGGGDALRLVPFPKEVRLEAGVCPLDRPWVLEVADGGFEVFGRVLNAELQRAGLPAVAVRAAATPAPGPGFRLFAGTAAAASLPPPLPANPAPEAYALAVREDGIVGVAREPAGLFHSLQTLCQLIRANRTGATLPGLTIQDWPSLRWRAFQDDLTRGPSSTLATLQFEAGLGAYLKFNLMTYYMESQYAFRKHPRIGPPDGSLTPEALSALVTFARDRHMDILGNQQSFGHFGRILGLPEYAALRETPDVLTPVREETYQLLDDLYSEVCPRLPFPWFNVCCDETWGLGTGPAQELATRIGVGGVYVQHIRRVHDLLRDRHGKRMMMWGDIILQHPDRLADVPRDTLMLTWGYDARPSFEDQIVPFARSGYEFFVCPGVNNWSRILPDFGVAVTNIQHFVRDGVRHGALGMINTDWEDDGEALNAVKWHADAWAAECAWNAAATPFEAFNRRLGAVLFGERGDHFGQAIAGLTRLHRLPGMNGLFNARFWEVDVPPRNPAAAVHAARVLAVVRPALQHLDACQAEACANHALLEALRFGARRVERIGQRVLDGQEAAQIYEAVSLGQAGPDRLARVEELLQEDRDAHATLGREFTRLWLAENQPYALDWTLQRYTQAVARYDDLRGRLAGARAAVAAGRALPPAEAVGLALPRPPSRCLHPRDAGAAPWLPELPWADSRATHRMGVVLQAGSRDRHDLPVEMEVTLPAALVPASVRVFRVDGGEARRELAAQCDPLPRPGAHRLVWVLPGPLARETEASVQVYFRPVAAPEEGGPEREAGGFPVPTAVRTSPGAGGRHWLENDRVRLLLGPEGAHLYRWEVKAADGRDLTMPGETGWAGFSDLAPYRSAPYQLECTARGPALVEFQATDPSGHGKTLRLYAGASWVEVFLSEPTAVYWDFDDPRNFAADGPTPGTYWFSNGASGPVGREADGVPAQVRAAGTSWAIKANRAGLAVGLTTPESTAALLVAPGAGAGGVGLENSPPANHVVTFGGRLDATAPATMERLQATLDLRSPVEVRIHGLQER